MPRDSTNSEETFCKELCNALHTGTWEWDGRFEAVLTEYPAGDQDRVRVILERYLSSAWDSSNIGKVPDAVQFINSHFGGLRAAAFYLRFESG